MIQLLENFIETNLSINQIGLPNLLNVFWAILILLVGRWLARRSHLWFQAAIQKTDVKVNQKLVNVVDALIYYGILLIAVTFSLAALGIPVDALVTILAVIFILVAIALQTSLSNFAATIIFLVFQTFKVGDWVDVSDGIFGQVKEIQMFATVIITQEQSTVTIPNGTIMQGNIVNYSELGYRRADMTFTITYQGDLLEAKRILEQIVADNEHCLDDPAPVVGVLELGDKGVDFSVRPFARTEKYWDVIFEVSQEVKLRFDQAGIKIPVPQQDIHLLQPN